jgi:hypothetical protein
VRVAETKERFGDMVEYYLRLGGCEHLLVQPNRFVGRELTSVFRKLERA